MASGGETQVTGRGAEVRPLQREHWGRGQTELLLPQAADGACWAAMGPAASPEPPRPGGSLGVQVGGGLGTRGGCGADLLWSEEGLPTRPGS